MLGVNAGVVGSPLIRTGRLHVRPRSVLCTSWIWLNRPAVKAVPPYATYTSPVRGSIAGNGSPAPVRSRFFGSFGATSSTLVSGAMIVGWLQVRPPLNEWTTLLPWHATLRALV